MKVGIAGAGTIIPAFLRAQAQVDELEIAAICATADMEERLRSFADAYGIGLVYTDYAEMVTNPDLDVIYVAVPNVLHYSFSRQALKQGKSVICEKPFCSCEEEAEELVQLARERGLFLFEAISNQYLPTYARVKELLPRLGDVKIVALNYSQYSRRYDAFKAGEILPVFDPKKSGGALMDLNVYNIHFVVGLFGAPERIAYTANIERGIDTSGVLVLSYPSFTCSLIGAKDCKAPACVNIEGDEGCIHGASPANTFASFTWERYDGEAGEEALPEGSERLYFELAHFARAMATGDDAARDAALDHSLAVQRILDEARRQAGIEIVRSHA